jgi:DNA repair exonuclease SbcCD ATPase subunit
VSNNQLKLKLQNYRRFSETDVISFPAGITIITGPNGVGKSTLAESISYALFGPKHGQSREIRTDGATGKVCVECELFIDDQVVHIIRSGNTAELRINDVVQVQNIPGSGKAVSERISALLGSLTREQFERTYVALQGDTAGLVAEKKAEKRRETIEQILQLEGLTQAGEIQKKRAESAKSEIVWESNHLCDELALNTDSRDIIKDFQNARTLISRMQYAQKFSRDVEQALVEQQHTMKEAQISLGDIQSYIIGLIQQLDKQRELMKQIVNIYEQQEEQQKNHNKQVQLIAKVEGQLKQVESDIQKYQEDIHTARLCADASAEYAQSQGQKLQHEKRLERIPLIEQNYKAFVQAQNDLDGLKSQLDTLARVDEDLGQATEQEIQAQQRWDTLRDNDPTSTEYEAWLNQRNKLSLEEQQNRQALAQLTQGAGDTRCPTCNQEFKEHSLEQRIQHLTIWLEEIFPPQQAQLQHQEQQINEQKKQWKQEQKQAEKLCKRYRQSVVDIEKKVAERDLLRTSHNEAQTRFLEAQKKWLDQGEDIPNPQEKTILQRQLDTLDKRMNELKEHANLYAQLLLFQVQLEAKQQDQTKLHLDMQTLREQQADIGYDLDSFQTAKAELDQANEQHKRLQNDLHQAELDLQSVQMTAQQAIEKVEKTCNYLGRFRVDVQEYAREEQLRIYLEDFKKHFFEANTQEVIQRTTQLLLHAVTDQSILGVKFDKNEFQYIDANNIPRPITRLSGGEKDLVGLCLRMALAEQAQAVARMGKVKLLILDEVLSSLDEERCEAVQRIFEDVQRRGVFEQIIMITHLEAVKQSWRANGLVVQKIDGKISKVISVSPGEIPMDLAEEIEI